MKKVGTGKLLVLAALLSVVAWLLLSISPTSPQAVISDFDSCARAGYPIMESYPERCSTPDGRTFTREIPEESQPSVPQSFSEVEPRGSECVIAGCGGSKCVTAIEASGLSTLCENSPEYSCYKHSLCRLQPNGKCGWNESIEMLRCLKSAAAPSAE